MLAFMGVLGALLVDFGIQGSLIFCQRAHQQGSAGRMELRGNSMLWDTNAFIILSV